MAPDLVDRKFSDRQKVRFAGTVLRLHGHALENSADEAREAAGIGIRT